MEHIGRRAIAAIIAATLVTGLIPVAAFAEAGSVLQSVASPAAQLTGAGVVSQAGGGEAIAMSIGQDYEANVDEGAYWLGSFTASETGVYVFSSKGDADTYGYLYADSQLEDELECDDDGGDNGNFWMKRAMQAGDTVYLKAQGFSGNAAAFTVSVTVIDVTDLATAQLNLFEQSYEYSSEPVSLSFNVRNAAGNELTQGDDYQLVYWDDEGEEELASAPSECGSYCVSARAVEGSSYTGETGKRWFSIYDPDDIGSPYWSRSWVENGNEFDYTGSAVVLPELKIYRYDDDNEEIVLQAGVDYHFARFETSNEVALGEAPVYAGSYYAVYEGIGSYQGEAKLWFYITGGPVALKSLYLEQDSYSYTGSPVELSANRVVDAKWDDVDNGQYVLVYYDEEGTELESAPIEPGDYSVAARAVETDIYHGETQRASFAILGENDLRRGYYGYFQGSNRLIVGEQGLELPKPVIYSDDDDDDGEALSEGRDYEFSYYENSAGGRIANPSEPGSYYAVYKGIGSYVGTLSIYFQICDVYDLSYAIISAQSQLPLANGVAEPNITVTDAAGTVLVAGRDYTLRYSTYDDGADEFVNLGHAPNAVGEYQVAAYAIDESAYTGCTESYWFEVYDPNNIGSSGWNSSFWPSNRVYVDGSDASLPVPLIYRTASDGGLNLRIRLVEGRDFEFDHFTDSGGNDIGTDMPGNAGSYRAVYTGIEPYSGSRTMSFRVYDKRDISSNYWRYRYNSGSTFYTDGSPVSLPVLQLYASSDNSERLVQGEHFRLAGYKDGNGADLGGAPTSSGSYYAVYEGITPYSGTVRQYFTVKNTYDLGQADLSIDGTTFEATGDAVSVSAKVRDADGVLLKEGKDYALAYFELVAEDGDERYEKLGATPSAEGRYYVAACAADGSAYTGITPKEAITIGGDGEDDPPEPTPGSQPVSMSLDAYTAVTLNENEYWTGVFTAQEEGVYVFQSTGSSDTYGTLYSDAILSDEIANDDDGGSGNNFKMTRHLGAGECVYLQARGYSWRSAVFNVGVSQLDAKDLQNASISLESSKVLLRDGAAVPELTVSDALGNVLEEGVDYDLEYYQEDSSVKLGAPPSQTGEYYVVAVARVDKAGGYTGRTQQAAFSVRDAHDLSLATITLESSAFTYTGSAIEPKPVIVDASGITLTEGEDYDLVYCRYMYDDYEMLSSPPVEPDDEYYVVARAKSGSDYTGVTPKRYFAIVQPNDLSKEGQAYRSTAVSYDYARALQVYVGDVGESIEPVTSVECDEKPLVREVDYTIAYSGNVVPETGASVATATVVGHGKYKGTLTVQFEVTATVDLDDYVTYRGCTLSVGDVSQSYISSGSRIRFQADGWPVLPQVRFASYSDRFTPQLGRDFTVSYADAGGNEATPVAQGKYRIVLSPLAGGKCSGTAEIPFALSDIYELDYSRRYPRLDNSGSFAYVSSSSGGGLRVYQVADTSADIGVGAFFWSIVVNGKTLIENLDYTVRSVFDDALNVLTFIFTGQGAYSGTITGEVRGATDAQDSFSRRSVSLKSSHDVDRVVYYSSRNVVYRSDTGALELPSANVDGLTEGVDFNCVALVDADGETVNSAEAGTTVYARLLGAGDYERCLRDVEATVVNVSDKVSLGSGDVYFSLTNGVGVRNGSWQWYSKADSLTEAVESPASAVALKVYGRSKLYMDEGNGFIVNRSPGASAGIVNAEIVPTAGSPVEGSRTEAIHVVESYSLNDLLSSVVVTSPDGSDKLYDFAQNNTVDLVYHLGVPYLPGVNFARKDISGMPEYTLSLKDANGSSVDTIDGPGVYTFVVTGAGDWSGEVEIPLNVRESSDAIRLSQCSLTVGSETDLADGEAKPSVKLEYGTYLLREGRDYTLEYGSNTEVGSRAWVKATAVQDSAFEGTIAANFTVAGGASSQAASLSRSRYELQLQLPSGEGYAPPLASGNLRAYSVAGDSGAGPAVRVMRKGIDGLGEELDPSCYSVSYSDLSQVGPATVSVTGNAEKGYSGTLSADFYLVSTDVKAGQVISVSESASVQVGKTLSLGASTNGDGVLSYKSSDASVATVDGEGVITGRKTGTATITVSAPETDRFLAASKTVVVTVTARSVQVISASDQVVQVGKTANLGARTSGDGGLTYKSSDASVAAVSAKGVVTGNKIGTAYVTITAAETSGYAEAVKVVTITVKGVQTITASGKSVAVKQTVKLAAKASGNGALTYATSNKAVATVNSAGVVTGKKAGSAKITITAAATPRYLKATKTVTVTVKKANTLTVRNVSKKLSSSALAKKAQSFTPAVIKKKGQGAVTYVLKSVPKKYKKYVSVAANGKVTVKKRAPKGSYALVVTVKAAGNASYAEATKTAKVKVVVK